MNKRLRVHWGRMRILAVLVFVLPAYSCSDDSVGPPPKPTTQYEWYWQNPLPQGNDLLGVSFTDANTGTAVGANGTIIRTTDGGTTWVSQWSGTPYDLYGVWFTDVNTGTAVGERGTILRRRAMG